MKDPEADHYYGRTSCPALLDALYTHMADHPEEVPVYLRVLSEAVAVNTGRNARRTEAATDEVRNLLFACTPVKAGRRTVLDRIPVWRLAQIAALLMPSGPLSSALSGADRRLWGEVKARIDSDRADTRKSLEHHSRLPGILRWFDEHF